MSHQSLLVRNNYEQKINFQILQTSQFDIPIKFGKHLISTIYKPLCNIFLVFSPYSV